MQPIQTRVITNTALTDDVFETSFQVLSPSHFTFKPGQFIVIKRPAEKSNLSVSRCYSLASLPNPEHTFDICFNQVPGGQVSPYLAALKPGDHVEWQGPMGHFTLRAFPETSQFIFVATGTGIAPMKSFIISLLENGEKRPITLFFGLRHMRNIYYKEIFDTLAQKFPNFRFVLTLSQPESEWYGKVGRVTSIIPEYCENLQGSEIYICGNSAMIKDVKELALTQGAEAKHIFMEQYY